MLPSSAWSQTAPKTETSSASSDTHELGDQPADTVAETVAESTNAEKEGKPEEIVVTGSRTEKRLSDAPVTTEVIGRSELLRSGAENLTDMLEEHPGIELERSTRGSGIRLLGLNPEHTLILVDGQRTTGRVGGGIDPFRFNVENIERVEIVKGAGSALYGSEAVAGVINIISRRPKKPLELFVRGGYGSFDTVDVTANAGTRRKGLTSMFSGGYHRSNGYSLAEDGEASTGAAYEGFNIENSTRYRVSDSVTLVGRGDFRRLDQDALDVIAGARIDRTQRTDVGSVTVGPEIQLGTDGQIRAMATYSDFRFQIVQDQRGSTSLDDVQDIRQRLGQLNAQLDYRLLEDHYFSFGGEGFFEAQSADLIEGGTRTRTRFAAFAQDEWVILPAKMDLSVVPSARIDYDSQFGAAFTPRLAVRYAPRHDLNLRVSYGWGFRAPTFEELYLSFLNPGSGYFVQGKSDLDPERSQGVGATIEYTIIDPLVFSAHFFWLEVDNLIDTRRVGTEGGLSKFQYVNVSSARSRGVESALLIEPFEGFSLGLGYVLTDTLDRANDRDLPRRARHKGTVQVSYRIPSWGTTATVRSAIFGERKDFLDNPNAPSEEERTETSTLPPAVTLDVRVEQNLFERFTIFAGARNLFDVGDETTLPTTPRSFYAGISAGYDLDASSEPKSDGP